MDNIYILYDYLRNSSYYKDLIAQQHLKGFCIHISKWNITLKLAQQNDKRIRNIIDQLKRNPYSNINLCAFIVVNFFIDYLYVDTEKYMYIYINFNKQLPYILNKIEIAIKQQQTS